MRKHPNRCRQVCLALLISGLAPGLVSAQQATAIPSAQGEVSASPSSPFHPLKPDAGKAEQAFVIGTRLLARNDFAAAQTEFARASALNPNRQDYAVALNLTRERRVSLLIQQAAKARLTDHVAEADAMLAEARLIDPQNELVLQHADEAKKISTTLRASITPSTEQGFAAPIEVAPIPGPKTLHLRGDTRSVTTQAAAAYGLRAVFDESVPSQNLRFDLESTPYTESMPILLRMAHLFAVPVDSKTLLVLKDTEPNRLKFERVAEESIFVPGGTVEQINELSNIVKNVFDVRQVAVSLTSGALLVRAPLPTLNAVNATITDLIDGGAQLLIELKLLTVDKSRTRNIGISPPTSAGVFSVAAEAQQIVSANQSIINQAISSGAFVPSGNNANDTILEALFLVASGVATDPKVSGLVAVAGGGLSRTGIFLGSGASLNLALNSAEARALEDLSVRVGDRQTSTLRVGSRYPIISSTFSTGVSGAASSLLAGRSINGVPASRLLGQFLGGAGTTIPIVQYEDLGLTLKTTPTVLKSGLVSMHIDLKIESLTGTSSDGIPILTSRAFTSDITVENGTTAMMLSELSSTEASNISGLPGFGDIPGLQETFADRQRNSASSELVLLVTPHLVRRRTNETATRPYAFNTASPPEN